MARRSRYRRSTFAYLASASLHAILATAIVLIASMRVKESLTSMAYTVAVAVPAVETLDTKSGDQPLVAEEREPDADSDPARVPSNRDIDLDKLQARREALFPFLTTDMDFLDRVNDEVHGEPAQLALPSAVKSNNARKLRPLQLSDMELQEIVDGAWSRRERWITFARLAELTRSYDPDRGQVPLVLRAYLDQNLLQLFCDTGTRVPRFWVMLENAADHIDFIEFTRVFTRDYPSSVATTELLFLLDKLAQASRDALLLLASIDPERELTGTENKYRSEFVVALQRHYRERLEHRQLSSADDIKAWYDSVRLQILQTVIATSPNGYRTADARFLAGAIHFERGETSEAIRRWREIRPDSGDAYVEEYSRLLEELQWPQGVRTQQVKYVLDSVDSRWRTSSLARLRYFGRTCESY